MKHRSRSHESVSACRWIPRAAACAAVCAFVVVAGGCDRGSSTTPSTGPAATPSSVRPSGTSATPSTTPPSTTLPSTAALGAAATSASERARLAAEFAISSEARQATSADGTYIVRWEPVGGAIPEAEPFDVRCVVGRADGAPIGGGVQVLVDAEMPHHGHGMNLVPTVTALGDGRFVASGLLLHMPGRWVFAVDVEEGGVAERAQWYVDIE